MPDSSLYRHTFYGVHWILYAVINFVSFGLFSFWVSFRLTQQTVKIEPNARQRLILGLTWVLGTISLFCFIMGLFYEEVYSAVFAVVALCGRFAWTFALRKSLFMYYGREHGRLFLPHGFLLLFMPVLYTVAKLNDISNAPLLDYDDSLAAHYYSMTCLHPALYCLINVLTLDLYSFFVLYDLANACQPQSVNERHQVNHIWTTLGMLVTLILSHLFLLDVDTDVSVPGQIMSLLTITLTLVCAFKLRQFMLDQLTVHCGIEMKINPFLLFLFPGITLLCAARNAARQYRAQVLTQQYKGA